MSVMATLTSDRHGQRTPPGNRRKRQKTAALHSSSSKKDDHKPDRRSRKCISAKLQPQMTAGLVPATEGGMITNSTHAILLRVTTSFQFWKQLISGHCSGLDCYSHFTSRARILTKLLICEWNALGGVFAQSIQRLKNVQRWLTHLKHTATSLLCS